MMKLMLTVVAIVCMCVCVEAQTPTKRRAVKTGPPNGIYTPAIVVGDLVFTSGQIGIDSKTGQLAEGFEAQFEQVFRNLTAVLEAAGSSLERVVKTTVFLADLSDFGEMNEAYGRFFAEVPPARSTVEVSRLPRDARVEIDAIALL